MKDSRGDIIYVGKAKNLKSRVTSYFGKHASVSSMKTKVLVEKIFDLDVMLTQTEVEALLLERTLIKHHKPQYNILLRDDKEYPWLRIDMNEDWPRIEKVRRRKDDGATYLGPYGSGGQLKILRDATNKIFPLIRCSRYEFSNTKRPCNYYHMKMCLAPCKVEVDRDQYVNMVKDATDFLNGRNKDLVKGLKSKMAKASVDENFELAVLYRDQLRAYEVVSERQAVVANDVDDADVIGFIQNELRTAFHVLMIRNHLLVGQDSFVLDSQVQENQEAMVDFLLQYYDARSLPREILLPFELEGKDNMRDALLDGHPDVQALDIKIPARGSRVDLVEMANKNATWQLEEAGRSSDRRRVELELLRDKLKLNRIPKRMECIDISNLGEKAIVASDVCFINGKPAKQFYRHYNIKDVVDKPNDYDSIREVMRRRMERGIRDNDLPDLMVIDGGKGQLSSANDIFDEFKEKHGDFEMELISLAKSKPQNKDKRKKFIEADNPERSFERVFFVHGDGSLPLAPGTAEYRLLTQIRDEAHRFAITHHRKKRAKLSQKSELEDIPGIGPAMRKKLFDEFGTIEGIRKANLDQLKKIHGLRTSSAVALYSYFRGQE
jgi:excinuclease ABC subunit C